MKVVVLADSNQATKNMRKRNSTSFYIETGKQKILFDLGSNNAFATNGKKLSVDISGIHAVVLSCGYADLGGGLKDFFNQNDTASVYVQQDAFIPHYVSKMGVKFHCGLDKALEDNPRIVKTNNLFFMDDSMQIISNLAGVRFSLSGSPKYFAKENGINNEDSFKHEQYLLIQEDGKNILFAGSTYMGISNVIYKVESITNVKIDAVFAGFAMLDEAIKRDENAQQLNEIMKEWKEKGYHFYTSRLAGKEVVNELEENLKDQVTYFSQGEEILI